MANKFSFFKFLLAAGGIGTIFLASCLNPVSFSENGLTLSLEAKVSGELDTNTRIIDNAVLWVINKTKSVDVTILTIKRDDNPSGYVPSMTLTPPSHGTSVASYHQFTDKFYTVNMEWSPSPGNSEFPTVDDNKSCELKVQMPRAQDYVIYIYRDKDGKIQTLQGAFNTSGQTVINNDVWGFDSNGNFINVNTGAKIEIHINDNASPSGPATKNSSPLVVRNVTKTADITGVELGSSVFDNTGPLHGGQKMFKLEPGAYATKIHFKEAAGTPPKTGTTEFNDVVILDFSNNTQAWHTLYLYFYRTTYGGYGLTPSWPPVHNDASEENTIEDILSADEGILQIINKSKTDIPLTGIKINDVEMLNAGQMLLKDDTITFIRPVGTSQVKFKPKGKSDYGFNINRTIEARKTTTLSYYDSLWAIDDIPSPQGFGSGLIKVENKSTGSVVSATVIERGVPTRSLAIDTESFRPDVPISYGNTSYIPVVGTQEAPIVKGVSYIVQLDVETADDLITLDWLANPLYDSVVHIRLTPDDLKIGKARHGANVTVINRSSATIVNVQVYNKAAPSTTVVFNEWNFSPSGPIGPGPNASASFRINSTQSVPIVESAQYEAYVTVYGNGLSGIIKKDIPPDGVLYDVSRTITVTENDLPNELKFVPVSGIAMTTGNNILHGVKPAAGGDWVFSDSPMDLSTFAIVAPTNATVQEPIKWTKGGGDWNYAELSSDGKLSMKAGGSDVQNIAQGDLITKTVTVQAAIPGAGVNRTEKTANIDITLVFSRGTSTTPVTGFNLDNNGTITINQGQTVSLTALVGFNPSNANINGKPISKSDLRWDVSGNKQAVTLGGTNDNKTLTGVATGNTDDQISTIRVTLPAIANNGREITENITVIIKGAPITYKTLRVSRAHRSSDTIKAVVLMRLPRNPGYSESVLKSGQTGKTWNIWTKRFKDLGKLKSYYSSVYPGAVWTEYACNLKKDGDPIDIPVPANSLFYVFVVEGDKIIRGYCDPPEYDPKSDADMFFVLDTERANGKSSSGALIKLNYATHYNQMSY